MKEQARVKKNYLSIAGFSLFFTALLFFPLLVKSKFYIHIMILIFLYAAASSGWNIVGGYAGQMSLGHAAFFGIGAYTSTLLFVHFGLTPWLGLWVGGLFSGIVAAVIGYACFRLRGDYFALATIAFAEVVRIVAIWWRSLTGGSMGILIPFKPGWAFMMFREKEIYYYLGLLLMTIVILLAYIIEKSRFGYYLRAIREDEDAAEALGVNAFKCKLIAAVISAFITGICGVYYAQYILFIEPEGVLALHLSIQLVLIAVIGGLGTVWGPIMGAFLVVPLSELLRGWLGGAMMGLNLFLYGIVLILVVTFMPNGLVPWFKRLFDRYLLTVINGRLEQVSKNV